METGQTKKGVFELFDQGPIPPNCLFWKKVWGASSEKINVNKDMKPMLSLLKVNQLLPCPENLQLMSYLIHAPLSWVCLSYICFSSRSGIQRKLCCHCSVFYETRRRYRCLLKQGFGPLEVMEYDDEQCLGLSPLELRRQEGKVVEEQQYNNTSSSTKDNHNFL